MGAAPPPSLDFVKSSSAANCLQPFYLEGALSHFFWKYNAIARAVNLSSPFAIPSHRPMNGSANCGNQHSAGSSCRKEGFADVARWIALDSDNETFVYRKFDELAARSLLYLQAELLVIEKELSELDKIDANSEEMDLRDAARTWETLKQLYDTNDERAQVRMDLIVTMRAKLKEYHEALLLQSEVARLKRPNNRVVGAYEHWFKKPYPALGGLAKTFLDTPNDLVALSSPPATDYLSLFLRRYWPAREELSRDGLHRIGRFNEKSISIAVAVISILVAAVLLVGSITSLYFVTNDAAKLAMIASFTALFALSIGLMTNARRAEIFAATAAYAAVLVVFVSGNISNSQDIRKA
ncbi:hypothetical protein QQS21_007266 [Conoideocrella luteorostrata]|uniref:DUF6594 domain-containing protein n=1 Tax=Conoideocrella luteorostrata TaxID=1105319 RepID=A0AAJ0CNV9_9HYPO|nr:hypothetical protein QQS21_007266 [Conoideocrella luteorostrata]